MDTHSDTSMAQDGEKNFSPDFGYSLTVNIPELEGIKRSDRINLGIYIVAAVFLFIIIAWVSGFTGFSAGVFVKASLALCALSWVTVIAAMKAMRHAVHIERTIQDRFHSTLLHRMNLVPMDTIDFTQKPDEVILTDGENISLWKIIYEETDVTVTKTKPVSEEHMGL